MQGRTIIVTGCDEQHHDLASDLIASLRALPEQAFAVGFVQLGVAPLPEAIAGGVDHLVQVDDSAWRARPRAGNPISFLGIKPDLPRLFPGFDIYVWLDGDTWVQTGAGIAAAAYAAQAADIAIHPECDLNYFTQPVPNERTVAIYRSLFPEDMERLIRFPMVNSGVFGGRAGSPLWERWGRVAAELRARADADPGLHISDQIPLHWLIFTGQLNVGLLPAIHNWQLYAALPQVDVARCRLTASTPPHEEISILHLSGVTKDQTFTLATTGQAFSFRYRSIMALWAAQDVDLAKAGPKD